MSFRALVAAVLLAAAGSASAVVYIDPSASAGPGVDNPNWPGNGSDTLQAGDIGSLIRFVGPGDANFPDSWQFSTGGGVNRLDVSLTNNLQTINILGVPTVILNIAGLNGGIVSLLPSFTSTVGNTTYFTYLTSGLQNLAGGTFQAAVAGSPDGISGGSYTLTIAAAVPEAHEWALMLAGLGLVGWLARRKASQPGAPAAAA